MDPLKRCKQILLPCCAISFVMAAILLARLGLSTNQVRIRLGFFEQKYLPLNFKELK